METQKQLPSAYSRNSDKKSDPNIMVRHIGYGPEGATCRTCVHLTRQKGYRIKCAVRKKETREKWNACSAYEEETK